LKQEHISIISTSVEFLSLGSFKLLTSAVRLVFLIDLILPATLWYSYWKQNVIKYIYLLAFQYQVFPWLCKQPNGLLGYVQLNVSQICWFLIQVKTVPLWKLELETILELVLSKYIQCV